MNLTIGSTDVSAIPGLAGYNMLTEVTDKITVLCTLPTKNWQAMMGLFTNPELATIQQNYGEITKLNTFLGINLGETPWNLVIGGGIGIIAVLIPIISGLSQWLSFKLSQAASDTPGADATGAQTGGSVRLHHRRCYGKRVFRRSAAHLRAG